MDDSFRFIAGQHHYVKRCLEQFCLFSQVRVFKFLCHRVRGREEEVIKTAQEIGPEGTPLNAVIEQLKVPLVHLAPPIASWSKNAQAALVTSNAAILPSRRDISIGLVS